MKKTLYFNGKIYSNNEFCQAMIVEGEEIIAIGEESLIKEKHGYDAEIDLEQRLVLPGFNDSHLHLFHHAKKAKTIILNDAQSLEEIITIGKKHLADHPHSSVLIGEGFNQDKFIKPIIPTKEELDLISKEIPIIFSRICGHIVCVNSKALALCGINHETKILGGQVLLNEQNEPNGILTENACSLVDRFYEKLDVTKARELLEDAVNYALSYGVTSIQTNDCTLENYNYLLKAYQQIADTKKIRIAHQVTTSTIDQYLEIKRGFTNNSYHNIGPLKMFLDGSLGARTAALTIPYQDDPMTTGVLCFPYDCLEKLVSEANQKQVQLIFHAIGNKAIHEALDALMKSNDKTNPLRHGIVHLQITDEKCLDFLAKYNICALVQPAFLDYDMGIVEERVGKELAQTSYAFKTMIETIPTSFGTDLPVEEINPFLGIYLAVTRRNFKKTKIYNNHQFIRLEQAIDAYTIGSSYQEFMENKKGRLEKGYFADFIIVDRNIFEIPLEEITQTKVLATYVGGKKVYDANFF